MSSKVHVIKSLKELNTVLRNRNKQKAKVRAKSNLTNVKGK
jgi:hypothetical protein